MFSPESKNPYLLAQLSHPTPVRIAEFLPLGGNCGIAEITNIFKIIFMRRMRTCSIGKEFITEMI